METTAYALKGRDKRSATGCHGADITCLFNLFSGFQLNWAEPVDEMNIPSECENYDSPDNNFKG